MAAKLPEILHYSRRNSTSPPRNMLPFAHGCPNREAVWSEKPLAQGNLLVAAPLKSVKVVRRRNRSIEHRVQFNGLVFGHKRGDTGRDFVRTQVVGPGHHLILDNARRYDLHGQFFPFVPDALAACRPNFWQVDRFRSALLGLPCQRMPELLWRNRRPQCLQDPSHPRPRIWRTRSRSV